MIGFSEKDYPQNKQLGTTKKSYGYKSDGKIYNNKVGPGNGDEYGAKFEKGDVVGCGLIMPRRQVFFTCNGRYLGTAFSNVEILKDSLYPSVCLQSLNEEITSNFGTELFLFDLEGFRLDIA